jgi:multidrug efflux system outer membrane protein
VKRPALWPLAALLLAGCTVGPDYQRPTVDAPPDFRAALAPATAESLGDLRWWQLFPDEILQSLIRTALAANYDVRIAAARILEARAQVTITRSFQFPELSAAGGAPYSRIVGQLPPSPVQTAELFTPAGGLDLSSRSTSGAAFRRDGGGPRGAARQRGRRAFVITTLVSDVGSAYSSFAR